MSLSGNRSRLVAVAKELSLKWDDTKTYWQDDKSREFEQRYLQELFAAHLDGEETKVFPRGLKIFTAEQSRAVCQEIEDAG